MGLVIVSDRAGRILAATHAAPADSKVQWGIVPHRDQIVTEVPIPEHLHHLDEHARIKAVLKHRLPVGTKALRTAD